MGCEMDTIRKFIKFPFQIFSKRIFDNVGKFKEDVWYGNN